MSASRQVSQVASLCSPLRVPCWDMGGCQNNGPLLDPHYNTAPNI